MKKTVLLVLTLISSIGLSFSQEINAGFRLGVFESRR